MQGRSRVLAAADGVLAVSEVEFMERAAAALGEAPEAVAEMLREVAAPKPDCASPPPGLYNVPRVDNGTLIAGRFRLERLAGSGGMGSVYRARDELHGSVVALKVALTSLGPEISERFALEAEILSGLYHPAIVKYIAHGELPGGELFLAMEWLEGETLAARLSRGRLEVDETVALGRRLAGALAAVHAQRIVHRDLKPQNVFLPGGAVTDARLLDFGIARAPHGPPMTRTGVIVGTAAYMAPEQALAGAHVDVRADLFALGALLHECLTGEPAFTGRGLMEILAKIVFAEAPRVTARRPEVPVGLDVLLARLLEKDARMRPASADEVDRALAAVADSTALAHATTVPGAAPAAPSLGGGEQRLLAVVLVACPRSPADASLDRASLERIAERFGGRVGLMFDGSAAITLVGAGSAVDHAVRAARCAQAVASQLPDRPISVALGRGELSDALPTGEVIARAAATLAPQRAGIAVADLAADLLHGRFTVDGPILGPERTDDDAARPLLGRATPFVGRGREIAALAATFAACEADGSARAALLVAEAGAGKSRVRREFIASIRSRADEVWTARADPMRAGAPFDLLAQWVRAAAGIRASDPLEERRRALRARVDLRVRAPERARVAEFLGEVVGAPFPDEGSAELRAARGNAVVMGDQIRRAWSHFIEAECQDATVVLVIEDLHWGDASTVACVDLALRLCRRRSLMVLATGRPEVLEIFPGLWSARDLDVVRLGPLPPRAAEALARHALGGAPTDAEIAAIVERAAGNAFLLEELLRAHAEGRGGAADAALAAVQARIETLPPAARRLLRAASVLGSVFWRGAVASLLGQPPSTELDTQLAALEASEWLAARPEPRFPGEREYAFHHALVREAAYAMLTGDDRALGHRLAAAWLERAGENEARSLAEHCERGGDRARAAVHYRVAAEQALEGNDLAGAIACVAHALACGAEGEVRGEALRVGAVSHCWRGEFDHAERLALEALDLLTPGSATWYAAEGAAAWAAGALGHTDRLVEVAARVEAAWSDQAPSTQQLSESAWTVVWLLLARHPRAEALLPLVEALAGRFADTPAALGPLWFMRRMRASLTGDDARALAAFDEATRAYEAAGDPRALSIHRGSQADDLMRLGLPAEAARILRTTLPIAERLDLAYPMLWIKLFLARALSQSGEREEASSLFDEVGALVADQRDRHLLGCALAFRARHLTRYGHAEEGAAEVRRAVALGLATEGPHLLAILAESLLACGRTAEALSAARDALAALEALGHVEDGEALVRLMIVETLDAAGEHDEAARLRAIAQARLLERAASITDPSLRESFLRGVPEHARTFART